MVPDECMVSFQIKRLFLWNSSLDTRANLHFSRRRIFVWYCWVLFKGVGPVLPSTLNLPLKDSQVPSLWRLDQMLCNLGTRQEVRVFIRPLRNQQQYGEGITRRQGDVVRQSLGTDSAIAVPTSTGLYSRPSHFSARLHICGLNRPSQDEAHLTRKARSTLVLVRKHAPFVPIGPPLKPLAESFSIPCSSLLYFPLKQLIWNLLTTAYNLRVDVLTADAFV